MIFPDLSSLSPSPMAFFPNFSLIFPLIFLIPVSISQNPILPKAAIFSLRKDFTTHQYVSKLFMGENLGPVELVLDLNAPVTWADCGSISSSESQQPVEPCSLKCSMARPGKGCYTSRNNSKGCNLPTENAFSKTSASGVIYEDEIAIEFWAGSGFPSSFSKQERFLFSCAPSLLLQGLANGAKGVFGLGNSRIALPSQFSTSFGFFDRKFSLCLPTSSNGAVFLGGSPYDSEPSTAMIYTPLVLKKNGVRDWSYYLDLSSIKVSGKKLAFPQKGFIHTRLSTVASYTTLETNIYAAFVDAYVKAGNEMNLTLVSSVAPFEVCFSSNRADPEKIGPNFPIIDLVLQSEMVKWRILGKNSMVIVSDDIMCLGFLNGGINPKDLIVIGGHQMEDYLLEFNLGNSMLGIGGKSCSGFAASGFVG